MSSRAKKVGIRRKSLCSQARELVADVLNLKKKAIDGIVISLKKIKKPLQATRIWDKTYVKLLTKLKQ